MRELCTVHQRRIQKVSGEEEENILNILQLKKKKKGCLLAVQTLAT